jgi:hypothetical protein
MRNEKQDNHAAWAVSSEGKTCGLAENSMTAPGGKHRLSTLMKLADAIGVSLEIKHRKKP